MPAGKVQPEMLYRPQPSADMETYYASQSAPGSQAVPPQPATQAAQSLVKRPTLMQKLRADRAASSSPSSYHKSLLERKTSSSADKRSPAASPAAKQSLAAWRGPGRGPDALAPREGSLLDGIISGLNQATTSNV